MQQVLNISKFNFFWLIEISTVIYDEWEKFIKSEEQSFENGAMEVPESTSWPSYGASIYKLSSQALFPNSIRVSLNLPLAAQTSLVPCLLIIFCSWIEWLNYKDNRNKCKREYNSDMILYMKLFFFQIYKHLFPFSICPVPLYSIDNGIHNWIQYFGDKTLAKHYLSRCIIYWYLIIIAILRTVKNSQHRLRKLTFERAGSARWSLVKYC